MNLRSKIWFISLSVLPMLIDFALHVLWNSIERKLTNRGLEFSSDLGKYLDALWTKKKKAEEI